MIIEETLSKLAKEIIALGDEESVGGLLMRYAELANMTENPAKHFLAIYHQRPELGFALREAFKEVRND